MKPRHHVWRFSLSWMAENALKENYCGGYNFFLVLKLINTEHFLQEFVFIINVFCVNNYSFENLLTLSRPITVESDTSSVNTNFEYLQSSYGNSTYQGLRWDHLDGTICCMTMLYQSKEVGLLEKKKVLNMMTLYQQKLQH